MGRADSPFGPFVLNACDRRDGASVTGPWIAV